MFIDIGAGKGRILCLAAAYPFRRIVGVELVPSLVADCRANVASFQPLGVPATRPNAFSLTQRLLYYMPVHRHHLDADPSFQTMEESRNWAVFRVVAPDRRHST